MQENFDNIQISEGVAPCELGGFVLELPYHHKVFANTRGLYVEIDTGAEQNYLSQYFLRFLNL
jgi:hypothetical protein